MAIISANLSFNRGAHELLDFSSLQNKYSEALLWAQDMTKNAAVGQYIYIAADETIDGVLYPKGPYVVDGIGENAAFTFLLGGNGSVSADTYAKVLDKATDDNIGQIIYLTADDTVKDEATGEETVYYAGPYIVKGEGKVSKLTTTNAEDVSVTDQVEALDTRMDGLEDALAGKVAQSDFDSFVSGNTEALAGKVAQSDYNSKMVEVDAALAGKVAQSDYNTFVANTNATLETKADDAATKAAIAAKLDTATYNQGVVELNNAIATKADDAEVKRLIGEKVAQSDYNAKVAELEGAIAEKVTQSDFDSFVSGNTEALAGKVAQSDYNAKVEELEGAIDEKVAQSDFDSFVSGNTEALAGKVAQSDYNAKVEELEGAIDEKVAQSDFDSFVSGNTDALNTKVDKTVYDAYVEANDSALAGVKTTADEAKAWVDAFKDAENVGDKVIDTLKEIQDYIDSDLEAADKMTKDIASKVAQSDFDSFVSGNTEALAGKVAQSDFDSFVSGNTEALAGKVAQSDYNTKVEELEDAIAERVEVSAYTAYTAATDAAIAAKVAQADYDAKIAEIEKTIEDNELVVSEALTDLSDNKANITDVVLKDGYVAYSDEEKTKLANIAEGAEVNVIEKVTLFGNELDVTDKTVAVDFQADDIKLGVDIYGIDKETGELTKDPVFNSGKTISETLQGIYQSLQSGLNGGITSVTGADDSIVVSGDVNNKEVKVQISAAADNRLSIRTVDGEKGLYVEPLYYSGDDSDVE